MITLLLFFFFCQTVTRAFNINPSDKYSGTCGAQLVTLKVGNKSRVLELQFGMVRQLSFITWWVHWAPPVPPFPHPCCGGSQESPHLLPTHTLTSFILLLFGETFHGLCNWGSYKEQSVSRLLLTAAFPGLCCILGNAPVYVQLAKEIL